MAFCPRKIISYTNIDVALRAVPILLKDIPNIKLILLTRAAVAQYLQYIQNLIEDLGIIIMELKKYKEEINTLIEKTLHNQNITSEYEEILRIHSDYVKKTEKVKSYIHALE